MPQVTLNYWAILVAAVAQMVIGALWYGPLFGKMWMHLTHRTMDDMKGQSAGSAYAMGFVVALVSAYVLAHFV
ncbi:MAG TPA: DUF1761 domain-containing protein, partial [Candidatus Paceibacterota bacterium]|nr:DUF1761 domain-containing protein [Candidatus Paceibacterota bacterium]